MKRADSVIFRIRRLDLNIRPKSADTAILTRRLGRQKSVKRRKISSVSLLKIPIWPDRLF
uniref:Uncharacterized protein n=1 Tax=Romanomermis culicivorax TaxID=13658 RepID=A0A915JLF2_ROMCU